MGGGGEDNLRWICDPIEEAKQYYDLFYSSQLWVRNPGFETRLGHCVVFLSMALYFHNAPSTQEYNLVPPMM